MNSGVELDCAKPCCPGVGLQLEGQGGTALVSLGSWKLSPIVSFRFLSSSLPLQTFPTFGRLPLPRKPIWRWSGQCWKTWIKRKPEAEGVPQQFPGLLQLVHQLFRCPAWNIRILFLKDSSVQHTGEECDLMSRLPVRRKERSKVTASVLTSGSKNVALK